ncbi:uncharacterized protein LOC134185992 isoform X2 [Corticium candelabrum]|uniref:uncharacterized protein LOC134185992 isoform X2 n=1 Tax=Corticium candelabrum TaxID=121492 RepID=UPI002E26F0F0|nr:uncharacterized protein LOC134185992 isoform X2 [Corticium candelabrum]
MCSMARSVLRSLFVGKQRLFLCPVNLGRQCCRGILSAQQEEEAFGEKPLVDIRDLYNDMKKKLDARRYVKASEMNILLNNCRSKEDIEVGVDLIKRFRSSLSKIRLSSGAVTVRACCRVGCPEMALEMMQNKISYGVFFSKSAYDYLIQHFCYEKEFEKAVETYETLLDDEEEIRPMWKTFHSAVYACCFLANNGVRRALKLNSLSRKRNRFLSIKLYYSLGAVACKQNEPDLCLEIMSLLTKEMNIQYSQAQAGLVMRALMMKGNYREAVCALESLLNHCDKLEFLPHSTLALGKLVHESGDSEIQAHLKEVMDKFANLGKRMPEPLEQSVETRDGTTDVNKIGQEMGDDEEEREKISSSYLTDSEQSSLKQTEDK